MSMSCPKCKAEITGTEAFCSKCGNSLTKACPKCGTKLDIEQSFCSNCGLNLAIKNYDFIIMAILCILAIVFLYTGRFYSLRVTDYEGISMEFRSFKGLLNGAFGTIIFVAMVLSMIIIAVSSYLSFATNKSDKIFSITIICSIIYLVLLSASSIDITDYSFRYNYKSPQGLPYTYMSYFNKFEIMFYLEYVIVFAMNVVSFLNNKNKYIINIK